MKRVVLALGLAVLIGLAALPALVVADNSDFDGDGVVPFSRATNLDFGNVCPGSENVTSALVAIRRTGAAGSTNVFKDGTDVTISVSGTTGSGLSATLPTSPGNKITLPSNWGSLGNNSISDYVTSSVTLVAPIAAGPFSGSVTYVGSGVNSSNSVINRGPDPLPMSVTATVLPATDEACSAVELDTTPPVITKSIFSGPLYPSTCDPNSDSGCFIKSTTTIRVSVSEPDGDLTACTISIDGPGTNDTSFSCVEGNNDLTLGGKLTSPPDGAYTISANATSAGGPNSDPFVVNLDNTGPVITLTTPPAAVATYTLNEVANADYGCTDAGSGLATCVGDVANGSAIDTSTVGTKTFEVDATDHLGNPSTVTHNYKVAYGICVLGDYSKPKKLGSTIPIKLQLCDVDGHNVSGPGIVVHAVGITCVDADPPDDETPVDDSGNANPDQDFRYSFDLDGYIYNFSTKGQTEGTWWLWFSVTGDPTLHAFAFSLKK
jgi:hypothetical protein